MFWRWILALVYRAFYVLHHKLFLRKKPPLKHAKLYIVGSFLIGGAGKTPFCFYLIEHVFKEKKIAVLCHQKAFDEIELYREKFKDIEVFACKNRYKKAIEIDEHFDIILCDDGFEDSRLAPEKIFRLDNSAPPTRIKELFPSGKNRSLLKDCPSKTLALCCYGTRPDVRFKISKIENKDGKIPQKNAMVITGIGQPQKFLSDLKACGYTPAKMILRPDHDKKFAKIIAQILPQKNEIIMTEKDAVRLPKTLRYSPEIFIAKQEVIIAQKLAETLLL